MRVATWNVNSIRTRIEHLIDFLKENAIDVVLLQEIKCTEDQFPYECLEDLGYNCLIYGQKAYNGVAIISKYQIECLNKGDAIFSDDPQARYIEAFINGYTIASVYVPNGQNIESPAYEYKLKFLKVLTQHIQKAMQGEKFIIGGDFNIARSDIDVYNPKAWKGQVCCTDRERELFELMMSLGFVDVLKDCSKEFPQYTWWDYRHFAFSKNYGLRLDYLLTMPNIEIQNCFVDKITRGKERPSDHAPVVMDVI